MYIRSIGCESDPTDELGRSVYLWTLIRLVDVWVDEGNECGSAAHEQIVRVCNRGRVPLPQLLQLPRASSTSTAGMAGRGVGAGSGARVPLKAVAAGGAGRELDSGSVLAPLMEKLMETGHLEEFVEQVLFCKKRNSGHRRCFSWLTFYFLNRSPTIKPPSYLRWG